MKKLLFAACLAAFCLTSCNNGKNNTQDLANQQNDSLNSIIAQKDSEINDMMGTLNEIQDGLNQISEAEHRVTLLKNGEGASKRRRLKEKFSSSLHVCSRTANSWLNCRSRWLTALCRLTS